jgi:hypothetical protein
VARSSAAGGKAEASGAPVEGKGGQEPGDIAAGAGRSSADGPEPLRARASGPDSDRQGGTATASDASAAEPSGGSEGGVASNETVSAVKTPAKKAQRSKPARKASVKKTGNKPSAVAEDDEDSVQKKTSARRGIRLKASDDTEPGKSGVDLQ